MSNRFQLSLAPQQLWQAINPWSFYQQGAQFGLVNIDLGRTEQPQVEQQILDRVGSYGKQLGHIGDALDVLLRRLDPATLDPEDRAAIAAFRSELEQIRLVKNDARRPR